MNQASLADELIADRHLEEFRENIQDAFNTTNTKLRLRRVLARAFISLTYLWGLQELRSAALLDISIHDSNDWSSEDDAHVSAGQLEGTYCLLGIYKELVTYFSRYMDRVGVWIL